MQFKARIKNMAQKNHVPAQAVLQNFMLERLLERISLSRYKNRLILKGGMLIASIVGISSRTTMDLDATLRGFPLNEESIRSVFIEMCAIPLDDEVELVFDHIGPIREDDEYGGFRVAIIAKYASINTPLKIDITTGDVITPEAVRYTFSSNFEDKKIDVWAYNIETILAEKVETILRRSVLNTRPRDFYDVYILTQTQGKAINRDVFQTALRATAEKRMSNKAIEEQDTIIRSIQEDITMRQRWERYCKEYNYASGIAFEQVIEALIYILVNKRPTE
jgi:predicted nucleotidyltransferase component of viral defense system